jgi:UDP-glucuronate decarboxylase
MIDGFVAVLKRAAGGQGPRNDCFNLGHPDPIAIRDLAHLAVDCAVEQGLIDKPLPVVADRFVYSQGFDDRWHRTPDITRAIRTLGYSPRVTLREGLGRVLAYYRGLRSSGAGSAAGIAEAPVGGRLAPIGPIASSG